MRNDPSPSAPTPRHRARRSAPPLLLAVLMLLPVAPLTGCVEMSRTEKGRYGNPLESYSSGPRNRFDAEDYRAPVRHTAQKPWYQRIFDW